MPRKFGEIAFTPEVKAAQEQRGSRQTYEKYIANGPSSNTITSKLAEFIAQLDGFYLGTVSSNGYPYIQFRGGSPGFLKVLDEKTLGFVDFAGNVQYITVGNLSGNDKAFLFLMDYRHRKRIKIWGRAESFEGDAELIARLRVPDYPTEIERAILFHVEATSENCPQHIPIRYSETEVEAMMAPLCDRIAELEQQLGEQNQGILAMSDSTNRPPLPPFTLETAIAKVQAAEDAWNTRDPERVVLAYTEDSQWRNRNEFLSGRQQIKAFLERKWAKELDYRLKKELWSFTENRISVRFEYEWHDDSGYWYRSYGNEQWEFAENGLMQRREASINDVPVQESERKFQWERTS